MYFGEWKPKKVLVEEEHYRIVLGDYRSLTLIPEELIELRGKVGDKDFFIKRDENRDYILQALMALGKSINPKKGFFKVYGRYNDPLEEFMNDIDPIWFEEDDESSFFIFSGNHREYSGVFRYILWNEKLIQQIQGKINESKVKKGWQP
jgi:hypothetical protein